MMIEEVMEQDEIINMTELRAKLAAKVAEFKEEYPEGLPQELESDEAKAIRKYMNRGRKGGLWGWDTGAIIYTTANYAEAVIQEYPDLMDKILAICSEYFEHKAD